MTNTHTTCYDMTHENDSQHDGKTFLDFLLALPLRANSTHNQLQALNLESHTRQAEDSSQPQAGKAREERRREASKHRGSSPSQEAMIADSRIRIPRLGLPHRLAFPFDDYHDCFLSLLLFIIFAFIIIAITLIDALSPLLSF